ncbi:hypothetical protein ASE00_19380 [Sphingomonas sp. Root710]|uniref:hypothetical protein n=1 Tax=Sphingomonas sp. Root710 TaxID=1736594 RepID=UPI0006F2D920|nr:hypothetical protein [Sphingomonas sp. Root710]KRB79860.1 hypothetical protein ASE00_19380 [Sphingomonas sp. Root710]
MMKTLSITLSFALAALSMPVTMAQAGKIKATKDQVRSACNKAGGELLGISEYGSYGCDNGANGGGMILCNKNSECETYTASRSVAQTKRWQALIGQRPVKRG